MKIINLLTVCLLISVGFLSACSKQSNEIKSSDLKDLNDSVSYAYGFLSGKQMKMQKDVEMNADVFAVAFKKGYSNDSVRGFSESECMEILERYSRKRQEGMQNDIQKKANYNIAVAEKFLQENKNKQGVKTTNSGLQYKVIKQGKGVKPIANHGDRIRFLYELNILNPDGTTRKIESDFDNPNTDAHLQGIDNFIAGFTEVVQLMNAGSLYKVWIHPDLGYGMQDSPTIPAGSLLIFDIEVTEVLQGDRE